MAKKKNPDTVDIVCMRCGNRENISYQKYSARVKYGRPMLCNKCMKEHVLECRKNQFKNMSSEKQDAYRKKQRAIWDAKSPEEKKKYSERTKEQLSSRTPEEWAEVNKKNSDGLKRYWGNISTVAKRERVNKAKININKYFAGTTAEERSARAKHVWDMQTPEHRAKLISFYQEKMNEYNASLTLEEKQKRAAHMNEENRKKSPEEKAAIYKRSHAWIDDLSPEDYAEYLHKQLTRSSDGNKLTKLFENSFKRSGLNDYFYIHPEEPLTNNGVTHSWDYGIFDENGDLQMVVDLDGAYYHGDNCDYDGIHSKEEYDERRGLSIPAGIRSVVIQDSNFTNEFNRMKDILRAGSIDSYINDLFTECRSMPFPFPKFTDKELIHSYTSLRKMKCDDKYHQDISLNTRLGDRLIQHFHESIWYAHRKDKPSPYNAWYDDKLLKKVIKNRTIYQSHLNRNKILQGFNVSKVAPKVSVFSAGRAKLLINKYLSDYDTIFDPFSGFSGRMLGTISLGKRYIGQDISNIHVKESDEIIDFLHRYGFQFDASVNAQDSAATRGTYDCLFTCPPYGDKEVWEDEPPCTLSCDDWIDICIRNYKCKRYVFVVDETVKYKDYIAEPIRNRSHFGVNNEYIIVINKII